MQNPIDPKDLKDIKAYVEEFERNGQATNVHHLRQLIDEVERLASVVDTLSHVNEKFEFGPGS